MIVYTKLCYNTNMSENKGIYQTKKKNGDTYYRVFISYHGKHISLCSFDRKEEAVLCYNDAEQITNDKSIEISDYNPHSKLPFSKWVVLINFRNTGIYFATPIVLKPGYFYYYLSPEEFLKFDKDDLFYYASHKIMRRGNHLFVSDYGMQFSIIERYGIPPYSVVGRDYFFKNGDRNDFTYNNIELINRFRGVMRITKDGKVKYRVQIHISGPTVVGIYSTEEEAAIAYNKAADILRQKGLNRAFAVNYVDSLSPKEYAEIYSKLKISDYILQYSIK